jgi:hypothetical protein
MKQRKTFPKLYTHDNKSLSQICFFRDNSVTYQCSRFGISMKLRESWNEHVVTIVEPLCPCDSRFMLQNPAEKYTVGV